MKWKPLPHCDVPSHQSHLVDVFVFIVTLEQHEWLDVASNWNKRDQEDGGEVWGNESSSCHTHFLFHSAPHTHH